MQLNYVTGLYLNACPLRAILCLALAACLTFCVTFCMRSFFRLPWLLCLKRKPNNNKLWGRLTVIHCRYLWYTLVVFSNSCCGCNCRLTKARKSLEERSSKTPLKHSKADEKERASSVSSSKPGQPEPERLVASVTSMCDKDIVLKAGKLYQPWIDSKHCRPT